MRAVSLGMGSNLSRLQIVRCYLRLPADTQPFPSSLNLSFLPASVSLLCQPPSCSSSVREGAATPAEASRPTCAAQANPRLCRGWGPALPCSLPLQAIPLNKHMSNHVLNMLSFPEQRPPSKLDVPLRHVPAPGLGCSAWCAFCAWHRKKTCCPLRSLLKLFLCLSALACAGSWSTIEAATCHVAVPTRSNPITKSTLNTAEPTMVPNPTSFWALGRSMCNVPSPRRLLAIDTLQKKFSPCHCRTDAMVAPIIDVKNSGAEPPAAIHVASDCRSHFASAWRLGTSGKLITVLQVAVSYISDTLGRYHICHVPHVSKRCARLS